MAACIGVPLRFTHCGSYTLSESRSGLDGRIEGIEGIEAERAELTTQVESRSIGT